MIATEKYKQVIDLHQYWKISVNNVVTGCWCWRKVHWLSGEGTENQDSKIKIIQEPIGIIIQHSLPQNYPHPRVNRMTITSDYPQSTSGANTPSTASLCLHLNLLHLKIKTNPNRNTNTITNTNANTNSSGANCKHTISSLAVFTLALVAFWIPGL